MAKKQNGHKSLFSVIHYQTSLIGASQDIPIGVILADESRNSIYVMGYVPSRPPEVSDVAWDIIQSLPKIIERQVTESVMRSKSVNIFDELGRLNQWNLHITPAERYSSEFEPIATVMYLFGHFVKNSVSVEIIPESVFAGSPRQTQPRDKAEVMPSIQKDFYSFGLGVPQKAHAFAGSPA